MYDFGIPEIAEHHTPPEQPMTNRAKRRAKNKPLDPADLLSEHTEAEMTEACNGFIEACMVHRNSLGEAGEQADLPIWMHPDMWFWAGHVCAMGISTPDRFMFMGFELQEEPLQGKGNLYRFHKP